MVHGLKAMRNNLEKSCTDEEYKTEQKKKCLLWFVVVRAAHSMVCATETKKV
jgi:hypothetical protein